MKVSAAVQQVKPSKRLFLKVNISGKELMFLHDTGSQFSIITRYDYDRLPTKPPLQKVEQSGVGMNGSKFAFDGIGYSNLVLSNEEGKTFELSYEPVLVSSQVSSNIFGFNSEKKLLSCCRSSEDNIMPFTTKSRKSLKVKCYRENIEATTAYIKIAKSTVVGTNTQTFVKARLENFQDVDQQQPYMIENKYINDLDDCDINVDHLDRNIELPIENYSDVPLKLKKGTLIGSGISLNVIEAEPVHFDSMVNCDNKVDDLFINRDDLTSDEKSKLIKIISNYDIKMKENGDMPVSYEHETKLIDDNPVSSPARRLPHSQRDEIDKQVNNLLDKNCITPRSAYASPIVPVLKKDGSIGMCVDYTKLNKKSVKCNYPEARLEDLLEGVSGCDTFSVIDLRQACRHIPIKVEDREKTAFVVGDRKFEWLRMPFGLHGACFTLAAAMVEILSDYRSFARAYDDYIVASRREQHLQHLEKIFQKFSSYCLHINLLKSQIMKRMSYF